MRSRDEYNQKALNRIESILERLDVEFQSGSTYIKFKCPIHGSSKITSGTVYLDTGLWQCHSDDCNAKHGTDLTSFVMACLNTEKLIDAFLFIDQGHKVVVREKIETPKLIFLNETDHPEVTIPSRYYIDRGISREALIEYGIGDCETGPWGNKSIIPIRYRNEEYVGFTARSMYDQCLKCSHYHNPYSVCIKDDDDFKMMYKRWIHKKGTQISKTFYGIEKVSGHKVVLVEGISCVWKLWEHKIKALGCCGTSFGKNRANLLKSMGIRTILLAADADEAGKKFSDTIIKKYYKEFSIHPLTLPAKDVTEMSNEQIQDSIKKIWDKL